MRRTLFHRAAVALALACGSVHGQDTAPEDPPIPRAEPVIRPAEPAASPTPSGPKSAVYYALLPASVEGGVVREAMVGRMVDAVVMSAAGKNDIASAWRVFVQPNERIGIKVSASGAPVSSTHAAVVAAVVEGLLAAGVPAGNIVIWDRLQRDLQNAGYERLARKFRVVGTDEAGGYDEKAKVTAAVMGQLIVGDRDFSAKRDSPASSTSYISSVLTGQVDKVVHIPALADSMFAGLQGALAGMVLGNLDNWRRLARQPHYGDPYLPEIYADPRIGGKVVLTILDALRPQYAGGPFPGAQFLENYGAIFGSRDPVAIDATGLRLLDDFRKEAKLDPLAKKTTWLDSAEFLGLGAAAENRIDLVRTGLQGEVRMSRP
ncbi:MAG: hypothetical protein RIR25_1266 [Verrucomicrobiota bacterium]